MPPKLPRISGEETIRILQRLGFVAIRQRGSHVVLKKRTSASKAEITCVVPLHRELAIGTLRGILRQAQVTPEQFLTSSPRLEAGGFPPSRVRFPVSLAAGFYDTIRICSYARLHRPKFPRAPRYFSVLLVIRSMVLAPGSRKRVYSG